MIQYWCFAISLLGPTIFGATAYLVCVGSIKFSTNWQRFFFSGPQSESDITFYSSVLQPVTAGVSWLGVSIDESANSAKRNFHTQTCRTTELHQLLNDGVTTSIKRDFSF